MNVIEKVGKVKSLCLIIFHILVSVCKTFHFLYGLFSFSSSVISSSAVSFLFYWSTIRMISFIDFNNEALLTAFGVYSDKSGRCKFGIRVRRRRWRDREATIWRVDAWRPN